MDSIRVGLIGLGSVANIHTQAYRVIPNIEIVGCFDLDPLRVEAFSSQHDIPAYYSLRDLLEIDSLDIACVLTPAHAHEQVVLACASAGIDVLCEKPLALSVGACDRMIAACSRANVKLCYGASYRYLPAVAKAKELIDAGAIGDIVLMREWAVGGSGATGRQTMGEAHYPIGGPGGSGMGLIDHGVHLVDLFSWLSGAGVTRIAGRGNVAGAPQRPEYVMLEYSSGALGELVYEDGTFSTELPTEGIFSWGAGWDVDGPVPPGCWQPHPGSIHVHGTQGALRIFYYANALYMRSAAGIHQVKLDGEPAPAHFAVQMCVFADAIRTGAPIPVSAEAGREACRLILSVYPVPA